MPKKKKTKATSTPKSAVDVILEKYGRGSIQRLGGGASTYEAISTGSLALDEAIGIGGLPRGRIVEIYGPESSGKTTVALHTVASAQAMGLRAAFVDAEHAIDPEYASAIGVDLDSLVISQPDSGEQALDVLQILTESGEYGVVVVDSVAALTPKAEINGEIGDSHVGLQARLMGQCLRKLTSVASRTKTLVIFINQLRMKIGVMFGNPETTPGGNALKFYTSVRVDVRRRETISEGDTKVATTTRARIVKNKCAPPFKEALFDIRYGVGIDRAAEVLDYAVARGVIEKSGAWYAMDGEKIGQGRGRATEHLRDPETFEAVRARVLGGKE